MIELNRDRLSKAIEKARYVRNFVHMIHFRVYEVTTPELRAYQVVFDIRDGKKLASCNCKAGKRGQACYHIASAIGLHMAIAKMRAEAGEPAVAPKPEAPRDILIKRDCNHKECKTSRCEKGQRIGGIEI